MAFAPLAPDPTIERAIRRRRTVRLALIGVLAALLVVAALRTWQSVSGHGSKAHVATKLVTVIETTPQRNGVHVRARLDAPSPKGTSHELEGVVPLATWNQTKVLWACYPPSDPDRGELRTPLDPDCVDLVKQHD